MKLSIFAIILTACGGEQLTTQQQGDVALAATEIAVCQAEVRACKADAGDAARTRCWPEYDACLTSAGLKDGGSHD